MDAKKEATGRFLPRLMAVLLGWAVFLAVGASLWGYDFRKGAIIVGCMATFLAFWIMALLARKRQHP